MIALIGAFMLCADPLAGIAAEAGGRVGAAARVLENGKNVLGFHDREQFPMQSVYKLPIGMATLAEVDRGKLRLPQMIHVNKSEYVSPGQYSPLRDAHPDGADVTVEELLRLAVSESDGSASDVLLRLIGGPATVMNYLRSAGVKNLMVRDSEMTLGRDWSAQYRNWATPDGAIGLLSALFEARGVPPESHEFLMKLLVETPTPSSRIKGQLPAGTVVAHKTGTSGQRNGITAATNDIGIITLPDGRHLAVVIFVSDSPASAETRDGVIAKLARAAWDSAIKN